MGEAATNSLTIGQVARRSGVGVETVRFYERQGLLAKPARTASGYRQFDDEAIARLQFIGRAKELGFTLGEIKELLALRSDGSTSCNDVRARAEAKIADIDARMETLRCMKKSLVRLTKECGNDGQSSECAILGALDGRQPNARKEGEQ